MCSNSDAPHPRRRANATGDRRGARLAAAVLAVAIAGPAWADQSTETAANGVALAEQRAAEAFEANSRGQYASAVTLYSQAYAASPSAPILYNIARIYDTRLSDRAQAISFYRHYLDSGDTRPDLAATARRRLEQLEAPATEAAARGQAQQAKGLDGAAPTAAVSRTHDGWSSERWVGVVLGAAGLVAAGVGGGFGLAARSNANTAHQLCNGNACASQQGVDAARAGKRDALISDVGLGVGGALLLTGGILYALGADRPRERTSESSETSEASAHSEPALQLQARADGSAWALQVAGRW